MDNEMKPCPFCGGKPVLWLHEDRRSLLIECDECGARIFGYRSIDEVIEAWNERVNERANERNDDLRGRMSRYINADAIEYHEVFEGDEFVRVAYGDDIDELPTADVVEVVRCKDCKWLDTYTINGEEITACNNENAFFRDVRCDEHCSCGERREDG